MTKSCLLEIVGLSATIGGRTILHDVSLDVHAGEVVGLLGPSGSGKSTFFRAVAGEGPGSLKHLRLTGTSIASMPSWQRARLGLGFMPQEPSVLWEETVFHNLQTFASVLGKSIDLDELLRKVDLFERRNVAAGKLSGGERRRVEFARVLLAGGKVLLCDEPFAGVDPHAAERLGTLLREFAENGGAVILADHHVEEALRVCTRALLLLDGAICMEGDPVAFRAHPVVQGRYLGSLGSTPPHS